MSRYDYIIVDISLFEGLSEEELREIDGLEFQTKSLEREFMLYFLTLNKNLYYEDFHYELVDAPEGHLFSKLLRKVVDGVKESDFSGIVEFYGKPFDRMYRFQAKITNGRLKYIKPLK